MSSLRSLRLEMVLIPAIFLAGWGLHHANLALEDRVVVRIADGDIGPLPDGKVLRVLALGFERLIADLFWIRTTYYVGDEPSATANYPAAERLANLVTDIDPHYDSVYVLMSSVLNGLKWDPDAAIRLLEKQPEEEVGPGLDRLRETRDFFAFAQEDLAGMLDRWVAWRAER